MFFHSLVLQRSESEIHKGYYSVILDNTSAGAAVEKKSLTLEKDKEDQSKHYLSHPNPPVMNWENRDINVVEWANIPKFSTLDDIVTPLRLLDLFFDDVLVDKIFGYTKLYSHREKIDISFEIPNGKIRLFIRMLLLSGCYSFQTVKCIRR